MRYPSQQVGLTLYPCTSLGQFLIGFRILEKLLILGLSVRMQLHLTNKSISFDHLPIRKRLIFFIYMSSLRIQDLLPPRILVLLLNQFLPDEEIVVCELLLVCWL